MTLARTIQFWCMTLVLMSIASTGSAATYHVSIDTSTISGTAANLAFDLINGDGMADNSVTVSSFATDGVLGGSSGSGEVSGVLPGVISLGDSDFFNEVLQEITLGSSLSFQLSLTSNLAGGTAVPDSFSFFILDSAAGGSAATTTLLGDALFAIDLDGTVEGSLFVTGETTPLLTLSISAIPEPTHALLLLAGLPLVLAIGATERRRRRQ